MIQPNTAAAPSIPEGFKEPKFRARRAQNWVVLGFLYALFYMTRYNFAAVMPNIAATFGWTKTQLGVFETMAPLVYGLSVFFNGPLCDRIGGKKAFLFGAVGTTIMNFIFGACVQAHASLAVMATVWGINGYFQSMGALSIVKVNAQWFHIRERGTFAGVFGVLIRFGLILGFSGVPLILTVLPLPFAFWLPGALVGLMFFVNLFLMQNSPKDAGFGELDTGDEIEAAAQNDAPPPIGYILRKVFASRATWTIAIASMMLGMVRRSTIDSWYPLYFKEMHLHTAGSLASYLPYQLAVWGIAAVGIAGGFIFGYVSDNVYGSRRAPVITFGFIGMVVMLSVFGVSDLLGLGPWAAAGCLAILSFFVNGAHGMIGGAASMDFGGRKAAATATGLFDGMQYLASAPVGIGMGYMLDHWGWGAWHWLPIPFAVIGAIMIATIWNVMPGGKTAQKASDARFAQPEPAQS